MKLFLLQQPRPQWLFFSFRQFTLSYIRRDKEPRPQSLGDISSSFLKYAQRPMFKAKEQKTILPTITHMKKPHRLHVYATKHNTHVTFSNGERQPLISVSTGNIGFRKAARGSYDAAYQLGSYVMGMIKQKGLLRNVEGMELIMRDFGSGREAIQKILLGSEGVHVRNKIVRVMDATRLKFGGVRSKKARRLG